MFVRQQKQKNNNKKNGLVLLQITTPVQSNCWLVPLARDIVGQKYGLKLEKC